MRRFLSILFLIYFLVTPCTSYALFTKRDYKCEFLNGALNAEQRHNDQSAFHMYEKAMYYYKNDKEVIEAYAKFCERNSYFEKAATLYKNLYDITQDNSYLCKSYLFEIKKKTLQGERLSAISKDKRLSTAQQAKINVPLIAHFALNQDWKSTKKYCDRTPLKDLTRNIINYCVVADEKAPESGKSYGYYLRRAELYPDDAMTVNKILSLAEKFNDYAMQEKFTKRLAQINPQNNGIRYRLAGLYETHGDYAKANKVYENLIASGDNSEHVRKSYAYSRSQVFKPRAPSTEIQNRKLTQSQSKSQRQKPIQQTKSKPSTEDLLYSALRNRDFKTASFYVDNFLKTYPNSTKFLQLKIDIANAQQDYKQVIIYQEKLDMLVKKSPSQSAKDSKSLAFCYSQTQDYKKALEIIDSLLSHQPSDQELLDLAIEYSMAQKNWGEALLHVNKELELNPNSEKLLKIKGDLCAIQKDFINAIIPYEKLAKDYTKTEYLMTLANLYQANQNFESAQKIIEPLYLVNPSDKELTEIYLNILLAQEKIREAYQIVKENKLEETPKGYRVLGDMAIMDRQFSIAQGYFEKLMPFGTPSEHASQQLASSYRGQKKLAEAEKVYKEMLAVNNENVVARMGLGYVGIDQRNFKKAREYFNQVLAQDPENNEAKMGIVYSYIGNGERLKALEELNKIPNSEEAKLTKAQTYYDIGMPSDSKNSLVGLVSKDATELKHRIKIDDAITITPMYSFLIQTLAENYKLDVNKFGTNISQNIDNNLTVFADYNIYVYSSGQFGVEGENQLNNVTNELRGGVYGKPKERLEFRADFGCKFFEFGGGMLNTDSWIRYILNDKVNLKLGVKRNNLEQSYLSAVGFPIDGVFTGRTADNKLYVDYDAKLPKDLYSFGRFGCGVVTAQNLETNPYAEGMIGIGKLIYNNSENKWLQTINLDLVSYNTSYKNNMLTIYDAAGTGFGGYFSPSFFTAEMLNIKLEGLIKKWRLRYGLKGFAGPQVSMTPNQTSMAWSFSPYISYAINDHATLNVAYTHFNYADISRDSFLISLIIRGFKNEKK